MTSYEVTVDNNMNNTEKAAKKKTKNDVENGKPKNVQTKSPYDDDGISMGTIIALILALLILIAATATSWIFVSWQTALLVFACLLIIFAFAFKWRWWYIAIMTAPRDFSAMFNYAKILLLSRSYDKKGYTIPDIFHDLVKKHPKKPCFYYEEEIWTYQQVEEFTLRVSGALKALKVTKGQTVGLLMNNCPEYPAMWLGIGRIGGVTPLINNNQRGQTLIHSITIAKCDAMIYGDEFEEAMQEILPELDKNIKLFRFTRRPLKPPGSTTANLDLSGNKFDFTEILDNTPPETWYRADANGFNGKLFYIYTSGTTGLPKAAVISSSRMVFMSGGVHYLGYLGPKDIIYCPMPLYHSAGGLVTMGQALVYGTAVVIKAKFSASNYFPDCIKYKATAAHYIGEMCRYILSTPPAPTDRQHKVRIVYGNGMRPAIWDDFVKRFNIKRVCEFYGATEGNANIINNRNKSGAIGFVSRIIPALYPIAILRVDEETGEPTRNSKGLCQLAKPNEPGVFIGKIVPNNPSRAFLGYVDKAASDKKVVRNVFSHGDSAFISGDILVADEFGYLFFKDRTGDTFRWRGENVSTTEVEASVSRVADQRDAVVYGVEIPNIEGRAGMCGIVDTDGTLDLEKLAKDLAKELPAYARPIFIRVMEELEMTGTFKMRKVDLQKEGFDPSKIPDKLFYLDLKLGKYLPLGPQEYEKIVSGQIRL